LDKVELLIPPVLVLDDTARFTSVGLAVFADAPEAKRSSRVPLDRFASDGSFFSSFLSFAILFSLKSSESKYSDS
jgi:hypothetical protein